MGRLVRLTLAIQDAERGLQKASANDRPRDYRKRTKIDIDWMLAVKHEFGFGQRVWWSQGLNLDWMNGM